jgi:dipeptidyl aminopeptidase/acylaminoacyl peptidase
MSRIVPLALAALVAAAACARQRAAAPPPAAPAPAPSARTAPPAPPPAPATATAAEPSSEPTVRSRAQVGRDQELAKTAEAVIDTYQNRLFGFGGALTHDGKRIVFGSNRDGSPQLYVGEVRDPAREPLALTRGPERVVGAALSRDGKAVFFTRDRGADEYTRIYRLDLSTGNASELTPDPGIRHDQPVLPLRRPDLLVYSTRTVKSPATTVVVQPATGGPARKVYEDPAPTFVVDASPDGGRALLLRMRSASDLTLLELDLAKGSARRLHPTEGKKEALFAAAYSADGKTIYLSTDLGGERTALLGLDARSGKVRARWTPDPATAMVDALVVSPKGDLVAARVNAGNRNELRLLDARTLAARPRTKLPLGSLDVGEFTSDGKLLAVSLSTPDQPGEPYAVDARTGAARMLRDDTRRGTTTPVDVVLTEVPAFDGKPIPIHAYLPKDRGNGILPVIAWFHGGPSGSSEIRWSMWSQFFLARGFAWVEPNIRGSTGFGRAWEMADNREKRGDVLKDMESVNRWIRAQPWTDQKRIVLFGGSYGGWIVLMGLTRQPDLWNVGVDLVGVADLATLLASTDQAIRAVFVDEFGDLERDRELLAAWSPLQDADRIRAPLFVYQGANDPRVLRSESDAIVKALRRNGRPVEYMIAADEGHSLDRRENQIEFFARSARFLEEHLSY